MSGALSWSAKPNGRGLTSEEMRPDHAIKSSVAITKLPLGRDILKKDEEKRRKKRRKQKEGKMRFFENIFSLDSFKLSGGLVIVHTASLLAQEHSK